MRKIINLNNKWAFTKLATEIPNEIDSRWCFINLPHTWNAIDGQDGNNDYYRGKGYYAKKITKGIDYPQAEQYYLEIRGANSSADIYIDGNKIAHHDGGYSTWRVNLTSALGATNLIAIVVDNSANKTVYPQIADFTFYGGLYRDVNLIAVSASHFDLDYYGGPGIMVTPKIKDNDALVNIQTFVTNKKENQTIRYTIYNKEKKIIAQTVADESAELVIKNVHLWHARRDPYLYFCEAELIENEKVIDSISTRFGCRTFKIDVENGFILNGEEYPLRGVSRHQDRLEKGNALLPSDHKEDIELIYEMGATTIRLAHYQHDQYFYDLCDEYGLVVWAEIPYISKHMPTGRENTISQMKELIVQNYNHPSIVVWGLSNEIGIGGSDDDLLKNHRILNDMCHKMDPTRLTAVAAVSMCKMDDPYLKITDVVSYNHYFGWYGGETNMNGQWFDKFHKKNPNIPIGCSEYGCEALNWHTSTPRQGDYTEEYQAYYHEELIKQLFSRKYLWATHVWNMFDFGSDARNEGGENGQNHKGLVTIDRKYKKDAFYAYKAWLCDEPFVHLCGKRYIDRVEDVTKVTVYSNLPEIELFANGVLLGKKQSDDHFFYFDVENKGETKLLAVSGKFKDESTIRKVDKFNKEYLLNEKGAILNWFDIETQEGYLSLNDKMSDILATFQGKLLFMSLAKKFLGSKVKGKNKINAGNFEIGPEIMSMIGGFTVIRLFTLIGGMIDVKFTKEDLLELNKKLNKIKAPNKK